MATELGQTDIRGENINRAVKGFALKKFKMRQVLLQVTSSKLTETYYRETAADLTPGDTDSNTKPSIQGVARGAAFPHVDPSWTKVQSDNIKFAAESKVFLEDQLLDAIDVQARTILRVARAIANQVDSYIYTELSGANGISTFAIAAGNEWDSDTVANRDPIFDLLNGIQTLDEDNYDALENGFLLVSPKDHTNLIRNSKVINNPSFKTADVVSNGVVGQLTGLTLIKSTSVTADEFMIIIGQIAATWRSAIPMQSRVIEEAGVHNIIKSWEMGQVQITDPAAIVVGTNTQKT